MTFEYVTSLDQADTVIPFRPPGYSGTNCSLLASRYFDPNSTFVIEPNPDISGIGVILAFLVSAYATLLFTIGAYWTGLVPDELLNAVDKRFFGAKSERRPGWSEAFREGIRAFSDQQVITGIAVLAAAFAGFDTISVYHWRTVVYLAWMSSNVHLTTLTVLRRLLQANTAARALRLTGMLVLFVLLVAALIPTASASFGAAASNVPYADYWSLRPLAFTPADPAACFWQRRYMDGPTLDSVISFVLLTSSYVWKVTGLFGSSHKLAREFLRNKPARVVPRLIRRAALRRSRSHRIVYWITAWPYSLLVGLYVLYIAVFDFMDSFAASILVLTISLVWGTLNLVLPRAYMSRWVGNDESEWNFGQYLPVMLLLLPVMSILEEFSVRKHKVEPVARPPCSPIASATSGSDTSHLLPQSSWSTTFPSRTGMESSVLPLIRPSCSPYGGSSLASGSRRMGDLEDALPTGQDKAPVSVTVVDGPVPDPEQRQEDRLYASRFFKSLIWLTNASIILAAAYVFFMQCIGLINGSMSSQLVINAGFAMAAVSFLLLVWVAFGALFFKVSL